MTKMKLKILNSVNNETFTANSTTEENSSTTIYSIKFDDLRMAEKYGTIEIHKGVDFWRVPTNNDRDLISISFKFIEAIMEAEFTEY